MYRFRTERRVEFADTDMGGIMHFSRYLVFMETAEHQFLEAIGTSVALELEGKQIGWPRVAVSCDYRSPARFGDRIDIDVRVSRKGRKSMTYEFTFSRDGQELAHGKMTSVCCVLGPSGDAHAIHAIEIPTCIAEKIDEPPKD